MPRQLRTLFLEPKRYISAIFTVQSQLTRFLDRKQVEVFVACEAGEPTSRPPTYTALNAIPNIHMRPTSFIPSVTNDSRLTVARKMLAALWSLPTLAIYARRNHIDVIHTSAESRDGVLGVLLARMSGARSIVHLHMNCAPWMSKLTRWALTHADGVLAVSQSSGQSAITQMGVAPERVHVLRNGIDPDEWNPTLDGASARDEFGIPPTAPLVVVVARIVPWKGLAELTQALAQVHETLPDARLLIVGGDDLGSTPDRQSYTATLRQLATSLGLQDHVIFAGKRSDIPRMLAAADVFALLTPEEAFGLVYLEAMAMQKPVVGLNLGGPAELIEDGKSGYLLEPGNIEQAAQTLITLMTNPALRAKLGAYGRQQAENHYAMPAVAEDLIGIYEQVLAAPPNRGQRAAGRKDGAHEGKTMKTLLVMDSGLARLPQVEQRRREESGESPRTLLFEEQLNADVLDATHFAALPAFQRTFYRRLPGWLAQTLEAFRLRSHYDVVVSWDDRVAIAYSFLLGLFHSRAKHVALLSWMGKWNKGVALGYVKKHIDRFVVWTRFHGAILSELYGIPTQRIVEVPYWVDDRYYAPGTSDGDSICAVGDSNRDYATLLAALSDLPIPCRIVSRAAQQNATSVDWSRTSRSVRDQATAANVTIGPATAQELREVYARARFAVTPLFPSLRDNGITAILEAMAMGKAVICTKIDGLTDIVEDGVTGLLVPPGDSTAMRAAILRLWEQPELAQRLGAAGRRRVEAQYGLDRFVAAVRQAVVEVATGATATQSQISSPAIATNQLTQTSDNIQPDEQITQPGSDEQRAQLSPIATGAAAHS